MRSLASELTDHLGFWLRLVSNAVSHGFADKLRGDRFLVAEWVLMRELYASDVSPSHLADRIGLTKGAVTKLADRLVERGLVERRPNPTDGRAQQLKLTRAGTRAVPRLASLADANDAEFFGDLTSEERAVLGRVLKKLAARHGLTTVPID